MGASVFSPSPSDGTTSLPPSGFAYRPEIDGLRALAVLAVILHHLDRRLLPSGFLGVDIFFVISGYVISGSLSCRRATELGPFLLDFYERRLRRLVPALVVCVLLTSLLLSLVNPNPDRSLDTGLWALFGLANLSLHNQAIDYFGLNADLNGFTQTWSLGVEEQFYLVLPLLLWLCGYPRQRDPTTATRLILVLLLLSFASLLGFELLLNSRPERAYLLMPARFWELGAGCLLYLVGQRSHGVARRLRLPTALIAAALGATMLLPRALLGIAAPACVLLTALLIAALDQPGRVRAALRLPGLLWLGRLSYSLYLWHWSVLVLSRWTVGIHPWTVPLQLLLMVAMAFASYRLVEQPLRRRRWSAQPAGTVARALGVLAATAGVLTLLAGPWQGALYAGDRHRAERSSWLQANSVSGTTLTGEHCSKLSSETQRDCVLPPQPGRPTLMLLGDSHAQHLYPLLGELRRQEGIGLRSLAPGGGQFPPFADGSSRRSDQLWRFYRANVPELIHGDTVLLSSYLGKYSEGQQEMLRRWAVDVRQMAVPLAARGISVVVMLPLPEFGQPSHPYPMEACLPEWFRPRLAPGCGIRLSGARAPLRQHSLMVKRVLERELVDSPNVLLFDGFEPFCPADAQRCLGARPGPSGPVALFRDHDHLTLEGSLTLFRPFSTFLSQHGLLGPASGSQGSPNTRTTQ